MARNVTVRLIDEQVEKLEQLSDALGVSVSTIISDFIGNGFERVEEFFGPDWPEQAAEIKRRLTSRKRYTLGEVMEILKTEELYEELREAHREAEEARDAGNIITAEDLLAEQTGPLVVVSTADMAHHTLQVFDAMLKAKFGTIFLLFNQNGLQAGFRKMADDDAGQVWEALKSDAQTIPQLYRRGPQGLDGC